MNRFFIHIFLAVMALIGVAGFCGDAVAATPVLSSLSPNPALVGQVVTILGSGFSITDKILVDNVFVSPINVVSEGKIITFIVPPETPVRDSGVGVSVKTSSGEYSFGLNLKVVSQISKAKVKKKAPLFTKKVDTKKINNLPAEAVNLESLAIDVKSNEEQIKKNELAQVLSTLQLLVYKFYKLFGK